MNIYALKKASAMVLRVSGFGATNTELHVPDRDGVFDDGLRRAAPCGTPHIAMALNIVECGYDRHFPKLQSQRLGRGRNTD